jgi:LmeA-like phospholipid-binding
MRRSLVARLLAVALAFASLALSISGCNRTINRTAERRIREALPDAIGPAREYRVHIDSAPLRTVEGKLANVTIDGDEVRFPTGLVLDNLHIELRNVDIDAGRGRVRHIGDARFTIVVSETSLDQFIAGEAPAGETIRKTRLSLGDNNIVTVTAERVTLLNVGLPFRLTGPIRAASPTRIEIDPRRLEVAGIPFSGRVLNFFKSRIESSLDLRQFPVPVQLSSVTTQRGRIILAGSIDAEALLSRTQAAR